MNKMLKQLLEDPTGFLGVTSLSIALEQRIKNRAFRKKVLEEFKKAEKDRQKIISLLEGILIKFDPNDSLVLMKMQRKNPTDKETAIISKRESNDNTVAYSERKSNKFLLKYSRRASSFLYGKSIEICIPNNCEEFTQVSVIHTQIGINKQLYFQLENTQTLTIKNFSTKSLQEIDFLKPVHIICYKKKKQLNITIKIDGVNISQKSITLTS